MPNLPKGEYVAFVYETTFANGHPQLESVVMVHEGRAGRWLDMRSSEAAMHSLQRSA